MPEPVRRWYIANYHLDDEDGVLYWSNQYGWVTEDFTFFTDEEHEQFSLPIDGEWACLVGSEQ